MTAWILVSCDRTERCARRIAIAAAMAEGFGARLIGTGARIVDVPIYPGLVPTSLVASERQALDQIDEVHRVFEAASAAAPGTGWRQALAAPSRFVTAQSRSADLVVVGRTSTEDDIDIMMSADPGEVILGAGRPVLMVPPGVETLTVKTVVIAWKDSREARRAVSDALPLLRRADEIHVVEIASKAAAPAAGRDVADWLAGHGLRAEPHAYRAEGPAGAAFLDRASLLGADLVVAGGYGLTRLREYVVGGFTRDLLQHSDLCCLFSN